MPLDPQAEKFIKRRMDSGAKPFESMVRPKFADARMRLFSVFKKIDV